MKVVIIGAGITGLTCALACQQAGIDVQLYERAPSLQNIGGGILLWPHGLRYLEWLGLGEVLLDYAVTVSGCKVLGYQGDEIFAESYAHFYSLVDGTILPIERCLLQQALVKHLLPHTLHLNKACVRIDHQHNQVFFADGTTTSADLIVAADGIHSSLRTEIQGQHTLEYSGHCWWGGIIEKHYAPQLEAEQVFMALSVGKLFIAWPTCRERWMWYLPVKMPLHEFTTENSQKHLQVLTAAENAMIQAVVSAPQNAQNFYLPIYTCPPRMPLIKGSTVLVGDAAHSLGPILGQGASQGIEDVFLLINCLKNYAYNVSQALTHYTTLRLAKYNRLAELENQASSAMINDSVETLQIFQEQVQGINLATMYQDLIPLVNEQACLAMQQGVLG